MASQVHSADCGSRSGHNFIKTPLFGDKLCLVFFSTKINELKLLSAPTVEGLRKVDYLLIGKKHVWRRKKKLSSRGWTTGHAHPG